MADVTPRADIAAADVTPRADIAAGCDEPVGGPDEIKWRASLVVRLGPIVRYPQF
jgi:hypothetical protein